MSAIYHMTEDALRAADFRPLHAGDTYDHGFVAKRGSSIPDLTGAEIWLTVKDSTVQADAEALLQLQTPTEIEITDGPTGAFTVHFLPAATQDIEGLWDYDIQIKYASGAVITQAKGKIEFLPNLTRSIT